MVRSSEVGKVWVLKSKGNCELGVCVTCCTHSPVSHPALGPTATCFGPLVGLWIWQMGVPWLESRGKEVRVLFP